MSNTYTVAISVPAMSKKTLYATDGTGEGWTDIPGIAARLNESAKDSVVAAVAAFGATYDVIAHDGTTRIRVAGTAQLVRL